MACILLQNLLAAASNSSDNSTASANAVRWDAMVH